MRSLPSVHALAGRLDAPHGAAVAAARAVVADRRRELRAGADPAPDETALLERRAREWLAPSLRRVLNATGVVLHTNLGRSPLSEAAQAAVARAAEGYANLELDLGEGTRGSRHDHVSGLLRALTGAEAAMAVNNGAGAVLLAAAAHPGDIVVSRGQLVEIGGGFRIPEVVAQAGGRLVEVGTTNRTRIDDYARAIGPGTGALLRAHTSNFRQLGFVESVGIEALCGLGVPVIDDVGSGALRPLHDEPPVERSVAAGAALVCFSGDKLLGGPQAGILVGRRDAVGAARAHPLARALRIDKLSLAALEATLRLHLDPDRARAEVPALAMLDVDTRPLAERLAGLTGGEVVPARSKVGGGTLPLLELEGWAVALPVELAVPLRAGDPPVLGRVEGGRLLLDPRTLTRDDLDAVAAQVAGARRGTASPDS